MSSSVFGKSVVFPSASWNVNVIHGPGIIKIKGVPIQRPFPRKVTASKLSINEFSDTMTQSGTPRTVHMKRVCGEDVSLENIPGVDLDNIRHSELTTWKADFVEQGVLFTTVFFEQPDTGTFVGTHRSEDDLHLTKTKVTVKPTSSIPEPPQDDDDEPEPLPSTPAPLGVEAVAQKLASELGENPGHLKRFISTRATDEHALLVSVWLDEDNRALPAKRNITDPCDPRYGNIIPASKLYIFKIVRVQNQNGDNYWVQTKVIDVQTGKTISSHSPDAADPSADLNAEVAESYDKLGENIGEPRDYSN